MVSQFHMKTRWWKDRGWQQCSSEISTKKSANSKPNSWGNMHLFHGQGNTVLERKTPAWSRQVGLVAGARGMWRKSPMKGALGDVLQPCKNVVALGRFFRQVFGGSKKLVETMRGTVFCFWKFETRFRIHVNMSAFFSLHFREIRWFVQLGNAKKSQLFFPSQSYVLSIGEKNVREIPSQKLDLIFVLKEPAHNSILGCRRKLVKG